MTTALAKAAFLDRDGVINEDGGYVYRQDDFKFIDGVFSACRRLQALDYKIIVASNQSGIARGYFSEADFNALNEWMLQRFQEQAVRITAVYYCPFHPEAGQGHYRQDSPYRKPGPQMILDAATEYKVDLRASFLVGDKLSDLEAGRRAGVGRSFYIGTQTDLTDEYNGIKAYLSLFELVQSEWGLQAE